MYPNRNKVLSLNIVICFIYQNENGNNKTVYDIPQGALQASARKKNQ